MEMKSPVESEFYPCRMSHAHMDDEKPSFEEDHEIYAEEMQTRIAKCKSECVKTVTRVNTSDFPTRVQQPVSKSHTHFKGKHSQSQRRKMRLEADYNLTRPRVRSTRAHPHIYHAYATHPGQMPQTGGVQAPRAQRHSPPVSPPFVIGVPTEIRPSELRQARPRLIGMPNIMTTPPQHPPPPPMCNMGPPKANIQGPRVGPPPPPQPQGPRQMINDQAVYGYQPRQYFMNKYKVLPPVYANLAQEQCYMGGSVPPYQQHAIYQAHYQSHNDIHQQTNNNYARFNAIQQQQQPNQPQIYSNWSPNWTGSGQLAGPPPPPPPAAAQQQQQQQPQPYNNQPSQPQRPQQQQQPPPQQQYQQPYMNHSNLMLDQSGTDQVNDPAAANNPAHKKKSIITSIFTFPRFVFKGFK